MVVLSQREYDTVPAGVYKAKLIKMEPFETSTGTTRIRWYWEARGPKGGTREVTDTCSYSFGPNAKSRKWVEGILGRSLTKDEAAHFDLDTLIGKEAQIVVSLNETDMGTYTNIDQCVPTLESSGADDLPF